MRWGALFALGLALACGGGGGEADAGAADLGTDAGGLDIGAPDAGLPPTPPEPFAYLKAFNAGELDAFGSWVALEGNTLVVAAPREDASDRGVFAAADLPATPPFAGPGFDDRAFDSGAVYVFRWSETDGWALEAYLKASNADPEDRFGSALALEGDFLAVGALLEDGPANELTDVGAAYLFQRIGTRWTEVAVLRPSNGRAFDHFGEALAISGNALLAGSPLVDGGGLGVDAGDAGEGNNRGAAYLFNIGTFGVVETTIFRSTEPGGVFFGAAVAMHGDLVAIGADGDRPFERDSGRVHAFRREGEGWLPDGILQAEFGGRFDRFGDRVAMRDDVLLVSAPNEDSGARFVDGAEDDDSMRNSGAAYAYAHGAEGWERTGYLKATNADQDDNFGQGLFVGEGELFVLAPNEDGAEPGPAPVFAAGIDDDLPNAGAAYRFVPGESVGWREDGYLKALNPGFDDRLTSAAATDAFLALGAPGEDGGLRAVLGDRDDDRGVDAGAVYVYERAALE
ncbi:MAG: FG-GAP repeat protein [Myxococcota bacterium]